MPGESLSFPIFAPDHASKNIREVGDAAASTAAKLDIAAVSAKLWNDTTIKSGKAADTALSSMKAHANATRLFADAENVLAGKATVTTKLMADQGTAFDKVAKSAERAAGTGGTTGVSALIGGGGAGAGAGMTGLIVAAAALSPVIVTLGVGLAGFGAAAFGAAAPVLKAAQATGGLAANMKTLNPEQQKVALGLLGLGQQYSAFEKQLQPTVLGVFNQGIKLAANLLHDVQPVAKATGAALGGMLGAIDKEFRSQTWQQFFGFMARTAGPDIKLLQRAFIALLDALPPLIQGLQPVATALLTITTAGAQTLDILTHFPGVVTGSGLALDQFHAKATAASGSISLFSGKTGAAVTAASRGNGPMIAFGHTLGFISTLSQGAKLWLGLATGNIKASGNAAYQAAPQVFNLNTAITALNTSMTKLVGNLLALQGGNLAWRQSMKAAEAQLRSNTAGLEGNTKNALANKQAILASTQAAISFASQELTTGKDIAGASRTVEAQIRFLQGLHDKSAFVRAEIRALREEERKLQAQRINQKVSVDGTGSWRISQITTTGPQGMGVGRAAGWRVPGYGGGDKWPALLEGGEAVVPKHLTPAVAPFLKAQGVPGFAGGGIIGSYGGNVGGLWPWIKHNDAATIALIDQAVVKATLAGIRAAVRTASSFGGIAGPGGGAPSANAALAHSMYASQLTPASWAAWNYVAMRESGWNQFALNPSSGAYGIAQALPASKYPFAGQAAGGSNPMAQISWMWNYMASRYGGPLGAEAHEMAFNWYDRGGWMPPGLSLALNTTGRPEAVGGGGTTVNITVNVPPTANPRETARQIADILNQGAAAGVKLRRSILSANG